MEKKLCVKIQRKLEVGEVLFLQYIESEKRKIPLSKSPNWSGLLVLLVLLVLLTGTTGLVHRYYWSGLLVLLVPLVHWYYRYTGAAGLLP